MPNEFLLIINLIVVYGGVLLFYKLLGARGLICWTVMATIAANIEVLILIDAFTLEQTLGNVTFASTFLVTDILSEKYGKKSANLAVIAGTLSSAVFILLSQIWLLYTPSSNDFVSSAIHDVFSNTPRIILASLSVYVLSQLFDVWIYDKRWDFSSNKYGDSKRFLWLRNNGSTLISQLINAILFNVFAFAGTYDTGTLITIIISTYLIYIVTSLLDTPAIYLARKIKPLGEGELNFFANSKKAAEFQRL